MDAIRIGALEIGDGLPVRFIAEGCDNHGGSLAKAKEMAQAAKEAGADVIKFQMHIPDEEMAREPMIAASRDMFAKFGSLYEFVAERALTADQHAELRAYCLSIGIPYLCTPFSLKAAQLLREMGAEGFKIGSGETEDLPFIEEAAAMGLPMIVSTGMSEWDEIALAVVAVKERKAPLALMHCISVYDSHRASMLNLGVIAELRARFDVPVGLSDHTAPEGVPDSRERVVSQEAELFAAVAFGACMVEKHFTLDRSLPDADSRFSLDPKAVREVVAQLRSAEESCRRERRVFEAEKPVHVWAKRSMVAVRDIPAGTVITREMLTSKRPGTGIRSKTYRETVLGKTAVRDIATGALILPDDLG